jgi:AcrR family transcriptional regulator
MANKEEVRYHYVELGRTVTDIANSLGISTGSVYTHIKNLGGLGKLNREKVENSLNIENIKAKEEKFLSALISSFDKALENDENLKPEKLERFAKAYQSITNAKNHNPERVRREAKQELLINLKDLAIEEENQSVIDFMARNSEVLVNGI